MAVRPQRDPRNQTEAINNQLRLKQLVERMKANPGYAPGGTGLTGLQSNDRRGYERMLDDQRFVVDQTSEGGANYKWGGYGPKAPPSFAELYQQSPDFFHAQHGKGESRPEGTYRYDPRDLYEQKALDHLRRWKG